MNIGNIHDFKQFGNRFPKTFVVITKYDRLNGENRETGITMTTSKMINYFLQYNITAKFSSPNLYNKFIPGYLKFIMKLAISVHFTCNSCVITHNLNNISCMYALSD